MIGWTLGMAAVLSAASGVDSTRVGLPAPVDHAAQEQDAAPVDGDDRVELNSAHPSELRRLPGIGEKRANAIVRARRERPFRRPADITRVPGIGRRIFRRLKPLIKVVAPGEAGQDLVEG